MQPTSAPTKKRKLHWITKVALGVFAMIMGLTVIGLVTGNYDHERVSGGIENSVPTLSVSPLKWKYESSGDIDIPGQMYITGTVTNNSDRQLSYVQVEINLYDENGNQVESTMANATNLEAHGTWKFRALVLNENAKTAKLKGVTGY